MARKKKRRLGPTKTFGIRKELERQRHYIELWPEAFVDHIRGSLGGVFDLVVMGDLAPVWLGHPVTEPETRLEAYRISIKAGSATYIKTERRKFKKHCDRLPILTGLHYLFDSTIRGSGIWLSESYPGDFEGEKQ